jgi:hypothetical protein
MAIKASSVANINEIYDPSGQPTRQFLQVGSIACHNHERQASRLGSPATAGVNAIFAEVDPHQALIARLAG